jgi:hypothetical protein
MKYEYIEALLNTPEICQKRLGDQLAKPAKPVLKVLQAGGTDVFGKGELGDTTDETVAALSDRAVADHIATIDRERNERDRRAGRGYDYQPKSQLCRVCSGKCRWCCTPGALQCGACFPNSVPPSGRGRATIPAHDDIDPTVISEIAIEL